MAAFISIVSNCNEPLRMEWIRTTMQQYINVTVQDLFPNDWPNLGDVLKVQSDCASVLMMDSRPTQVLSSSLLKLCSYD